MLKDIYDHDFHHFLSFHDVERRPKTEWFYFNGTPEKSKIFLISLFSMICLVISLAKDRTIPATRARRSKAKTLAYFKNPSRVLLWNAMPRLVNLIYLWPSPSELTVNVLDCNKQTCHCQLMVRWFWKFIAGQTDLQVYRNRLRS